MKEKSHKKINCPLIQTSLIEISCTSFIGQNGENPVALLRNYKPILTCRKHAFASIFGECSFGGAGHVSEHAQEPSTSSANIHKLYRNVDGSRRFKNPTNTAGLKGKFGMKNKSEAVNLIINTYEEEFLEPELRPEFIAHAKNAEQGKKHYYASITELRRDIEHA